MDDIKTFDIQGVEIFSAGEWNKDKYGQEDLQQMVDAFNNLKGGFKPYLKLGHDNKQEIVKSSGLPSIGWVENLYIKGTKLFADLHNIPKEIYKLIKAKAYRKVSCEIFWDLDVNGIKYPRVLGALALLGAETPGVLNLADILGNYSLLKQNNDLRVFDAMDNQGSFKAYAINFDTNTGDEMSEEQVSTGEVVVVDITAELEAQKKSFALAQEEIAAKTKELEANQAELTKFREEAAIAQAEAKVAKVAKFVTELESKKLVTPSMKDLVTELLSDKKEYTVKEKPMTKEEIISDLLALSSEAAKVNFDESSRADFACSPADKEKNMAKKIEKYASDNKCTMAQAYKAVMKGAPADGAEPDADEEDSKKMKCK
jgi:hypothetical protein